MKNTVEGIKNRLDEAEDQISELKDKVEKNSRQQQNEKRPKKKEEGLRKLEENMKHNDIHVIGIPEGEKEVQVIENLFVKVMVENFPNLMREKDIHVQGTWKSQSR